jgi:hypothetical protein
MSSSSPTLFEDIFEVVKRDPDGKKFDKGECPLPSCSCLGLVQFHTYNSTLPSSDLAVTVSRYVCKSDLFECDMTLDVNIDVYPLEVMYELLHLIKLDDHDKVDDNDNDDVITMSDNISDMAQ